MNKIKKHIFLLVISVVTENLQTSYIVSPDKSFKELLTLRANLENGLPLTKELTFLLLDLLYRAELNPMMKVTHAPMLQSLRKLIYDSPFRNTSTDFTPNVIIDQQLLKEKDILEQLTFFLEVKFRRSKEWSLDEAAQFLNLAHQLDQNHPYIKSNSKFINDLKLMIYIDEECRKQDASLLEMSDCSDTQELTESPAAQSLPESHSDHTQQSFKNSQTPDDFIPKHLPIYFTNEHDEIVKELTKIEDDTLRNDPTNVWSYNTAIRYLYLIDQIGQYNPYTQEHRLLIKTLRDYVNIIITKNMR